MESKVMLKRFQNFLKNKEMVLYTVNIILGLLMLTALVVFWKTGNKISMFVVIFSGGAMNLSNGFRYLQQKERKQLGHSMILFGVVILLLGVIILMV